MPRFNSTDINMLLTILTFACFVRSARRLSHTSRMTTVRWAARDWFASTVIENWEAVCLITLRWVFSALCFSCVAAAAAVLCQSTSCNVDVIGTAAAADRSDFVCLVGRCKLCLIFGWQKGAPRWLLNCKLFPSNVLRPFALCCACL